MTVSDRSFFPKELVCPVCEKSFTRFNLNKARFSISKRDIDYRPIYLGSINPRFYAICVCPNCFYSGEDRFFCPHMSDDELRRKQFFEGHRAQWESKSRVRAASSGQQIWKDTAAEKLRTISSEEVNLLRKISPLLKKSAAGILLKDKPINELQKQGDLDVAVRSYELAAICYKGRNANHRILGYTYLNGAWASRDAAEMSKDPKIRADYKDIEQAFLRQALSFFEITNKANSFDENFSADGSKIPKENIPQTRIFEILYIMAGAYRLLGDFEKSNKFLEQIMFGGVSNAQGLVLWFIHQAKEMRQEKDISHFSSQPGDIPQEDDDGVEGDDAD